MHPGERLTLRFAVALLALLFSVTLRALIPVGYMPDVTDDGFHLVICSGTAPADTHGDPDPGCPPSSASPASPCATPRRSPALKVRHRRRARHRFRSEASTLPGRPVVDGGAAPSVALSATFRFQIETFP